MIVADRQVGLGRDLGGLGATLVAQFKGPRELVEGGVGPVGNRDHVLDDDVGEILRRIRDTDDAGTDRRVIRRVGIGDVAHRVDVGDHVVVAGREVVGDRGTDVDRARRAGGEGGLSLALRGHVPSSDFLQGRDVLDVLERRFRGHKDVQGEGGFDRRCAQVCDVDRDGDVAAGLDIPLARSSVGYFEVHRRYDSDRSRDRAHLGVSVEGDDLERILPARLPGMGDFAGIAFAGILVGVTEVDLPVQIRDARGVDREGDGRVDPWVCRLGVDRLDSDRGRTGAASARGRQKNGGQYN